MVTKYENGYCIQQNNDKFGDDENVDDNDGDDGDYSDDDDDVELVIVQDENCSGAVEGDIWQFTERHH